MNKAHTATAKRIAKRYGLVFSGAHDPARVDQTEPDLNGVDREGLPLAIDIETSATLSEAVRRLSHRPGRVYIAVTNKEALIDAVRLTKDTPIGVMDPRGDVVKECAELSFPAHTRATVQTADRAQGADGGANQNGSNGERKSDAPRVVPRPEARGYTKEPASPPAYDSFEPIYVAPSAGSASGPAASPAAGAAARRSFAIPDAAAFSQSLPVGFGSDGARLAAG